MTRSEIVASQLIRLVSEVAALDRSDVPVPMESGDWQSSSKWRPDFSNYVRNVNSLVEELALCLNEEGWQLQDGIRPVPIDPPRGLGRLTLRGPVRKIVRGFLEPVRRVPLVAAVPDRVLLYLIQLPDGAEFFEREAHSGVGWHYHFLNWKKERSDAVLCWDTRWLAPPSAAPGTEASQRPFFVERHGESHAKFAARPHQWKSEKRESMWNVCALDLIRWPIKDFRCASNKSTIVWPPGGQLTLHPSDIGTNPNGPPRA